MRCISSSVLPEALPNPALGCCSHPSRPKSQERSRAARPPCPFGLTHEDSSGDTSRRANKQHEESHRPAVRSALNAAPVPPGPPGPGKGAWGRHCKAARLTSWRMSSSLGMMESSSTLSLWRDGGQEGIWHTRPCPRSTSAAPPRAHSAAPRAAAARGPGAGLPPAAGSWEPVIGEAGD